MSSTTAYENLYENLKNRFTVENDNCECTLGEYMLAKAREAASVSSLPVALNDYGTSRSLVRGLVSYVNEKLTIKKAPAKDKTMRAFPLRTSLASLVSALLICTLAVTYGLSGTSAITGENETANAEYKLYEADSYGEDEIPYEIDSTLPY